MRCGSSKWFCEARKSLQNIYKYTHTYTNSGALVECEYTAEDAQRRQGTDYVYK